MSLDFWNHPHWLGDSRDHPSNPNFEPFWMRGPHYPIPVATHRETMPVRALYPGRTPFRGTLVWTEDYRGNP